LNLSLDDKEKKKKLIYQKVKARKIAKKLEMELERRLNTKEKVITRDDWDIYMKNQIGNGTESTSNFIIITGILLVCSWFF
jgi:hypothetical protein